MLDGGTIARPSNSGAGGTNFAPVAPLQKLGQQKKPYESSALNQIIRELHLETKDRGIEQRREIAEIGRLVANTRTGKLIMKRDPLIGTLTLLKPLPGKQRTDRHVLPLAQVNSSQLTSIWTLARPKIVPRHFGNNNKAQIQHALIEKILEHYDKQSFDEFFHQSQSLDMMDWGTSAIRSFYDDKLNTMYRLQPIIENTDQTIFEGYGFCRECMHDGDPEQFAPRDGTMPQCPECGSYNLSDMTPKQTASVPQIVGAREIAQGDIGHELLPIPALNWDQRVLIQDSSFVHYRSEVPQRLVSSILGVEVAEQNPDSDPLLRALNAVGSRGGSLQNLGRENLDGNTGFSGGVTVMDEEWYKPEWYVGRTLPKDEMTASGELLPAGVPLEQLFPEGLCAAGFNDMDVLWFVGTEKCRIKSGVYHIQSQSGVGEGIAAAVPITEQLNIAHTANIEVVKRAGAGGGYAFDREAMTQREAKMLLKPGALVGLKMRGTRYTSVDQMITQFIHNPQNQESLALVASLTNLLNICFQTTEFTNGVASDKIDVNTLGGQQMLFAQNQQRSAATLRMKGYLYASVGEDTLELFRENIKAPMFFGTNDKFALAKGRFISGADLPERIKCDAVKDSEIPSNTYTQQQAAIQMLEKSQFFGDGGFVALIQFSPRIAAWWASQFPGVEIPLFNQTEILIVCQERLESMREKAAEIEQRLAISGYFPPLEMAAQEVIASIDRTVAMSEENHIVKAEVLKEYLDDDEVKEWSPLLRASVEALIQLHYTYDRNNRFRVPMLDLEGQSGMAAMQATAQNEIMRPQMEEERDSALLEEGLGRVADEVQKSLDQDRGEESAQADHARKMEQIEKQNDGRKQSGANIGSRRTKSK